MVTQALFELPVGWPAMSTDQVRAALTAPGSKFEMETVDIRGQATRVWKNAPPSLPFLLTAARAYGDRPLAVYEEERVSYGANHRAAAAIAHHLVGMGVGKGDRVALAMRNLPEWVAIFFGITATGAIAVPLNAWWTGAELEYGLADSGSVVAFIDEERHARLRDSYERLPDLRTMIVARARGELAGHAQRLEDAIGSPPGYALLPERPLPDVAIAPDDDATILYTSGTTGAPKGALGTHRNLMTNILSSGYAGARTLLRRGEVPPAAPEPKTFLTVIPLFHATALSATLMGAMASGSTMVLMRKWDTVAAMRLIERERVQVTGGVPTIAWQLLEHPDRGDYDLSSLEAIAYGGAPSAPDLVRRIHAEFGALPGNGWGMTETTATVTGISAEDYLNRPTSAGLPVATADLKIMDEEGANELPTGEVGELWARGPMIVRGYWNKPEATAQTFIDGWVRTGDLARLDKEGFVYIVDRAKDMIIRGGENIYSTEVENRLYAHPAVTDCALVGVLHRTLGEEPAAVVHLRPGAHATEAELQDWVRQRLAAFKVPVAIRFVHDILPRNANGKILKRELRELFADRAAA